MIEKRLVGQLGDRYQNAELLELSRNNYLIANKVRLPVLGKPLNILARNKETLSKNGFLRMKDT